MRARFYITALLALLFLHFTYAQQRVDSLRRMLHNQLSDSARLNAMVDLAKSYHSENKDDSCIAVSRRGIVLARKANNLEAEFSLLNEIGLINTNYGNYPEAMATFLDVEKRADEAKAYLKVFNSLVNIGNIYSDQKDYKEAIKYTQTAIKLAERIKSDPAFLLAAGNLGSLYIYTHQLDSALYYTNITIEKATAMKDRSMIYTALSNFAEIYSAQGQSPIALGYYRSVVGMGRADSTLLFSSEPILGLAKLFDIIGQRDSALYYGQAAIKIAKMVQIKNEQLKASNFLANYFQKEHSNDSALAYLRLSVQLKDSIYGEEKLHQLQAITFQESLRQMSLQEEKEHEAEEHSRNIQYAIISIAVISFMFVYFLLSSRLIIQDRWIRFFGVLGLLLVFEFVNLVMHPFLEENLHHSPALMLLTLVLIAALLIPLHHKIEHKVLDLLIERNKKMRLSAAKRTIMKLEDQTK